MFVLLYTLFTVYVWKCRVEILRLQQGNDFNTIISDLKIFPDVSNEHKNTRALEFLSSNEFVSVTEKPEHEKHSG